MPRRIGTTLRSKTADPAQMHTIDLPRRTNALRAVHRTVGLSPIGQVRLRRYERVLRRRTGGLRD